MSLIGTRSLFLVRMTKFFHQGGQGDKYELAKQVFSTPSNVNSYIHKLKDLGIARIVAWKSVKGSGASKLAIYGWGGGEPDEPMPIQPKSMRFDARNSITAERALKVLESGPKTAAQVGDALGLKQESASAVLRQMKRQDMAHIVAWVKSNPANFEPPHPPIRVYAAGPGTDAPRPKAITHAKAVANRKRALTERFGADIARRITTSRADGGPDKICLDGRTAYVRGKPRGRGKAKQEKQA